MTSSDKPRARAIAFYLPQFHPIPENDAWWGKGFTEWSNVTRARPLFDGHYQPRLPADLGFYDLRLPQILEAQAELARSYGIYGFCYHYYFFKDGKRLLEKPLEQMLQSGRPDFPFCLCWANENWTRRWDGLENEVLQAQELSPETERAFMQSVLPYFRDPRYIRIRGRPVLIIYRASIFPDFAATVARWQAQLREAGEAPVNLIVVEAYDLRTESIAHAAIDATCEFPPHGQFNRSLGEFSVEFHAPFSGTVFDYEKVAAYFLERPALQRRRYKTVTLGWDNTARKKSSAVIMVNFSLDAYHHWLSGIVDEATRVLPEEERFVFINAWNEWAEGTYLEPDQLFGHAYLEATHAALLGRPYRASVARLTGHRAQRTDAAKRAGPPVESSPQGSDRPSRRSIVVVANAGHDRDLVEAFVRENVRYAGRVVLAVRREQEATLAVLRALAEEGLPVSIRVLEGVRSTERSAINQLLREEIQDAAIRWLLPLDTDEFIDAEDPDALAAALHAAAAHHGRVPWIIHAPTPFDDPKEPHPLKRIRHRYAYDVPDPKINPRVWRLVINCALLRPFVDRFELNDGMNSLVFRGSETVARQPVTGLAAVALRHFPVRFASSQKPSAREYLEMQRVRPEHTIGTPLIVDPFPVSSELRYSAPASS